LAFLDYLASDEIGVLVKDAQGNFILNKTDENGRADLNGFTFDQLEQFLINKFMISEEDLYLLLGTAVATQEGQTQ
jgi:hypothetical protein